MTEHAQTIVDFPSVDDGDIAASEKTVEKKAKRYAYTDIGNGERFRDRHGENVRYLFGSDCWYIWDGYKWNADRGDAVQRLAKDAILKIFDEFCLADNIKHRNKHAFASQSNGALNSMLTPAQSELPIPFKVDLFDADPYFLNVKNGTVDLRTGEIHEHRRDSYCTKIIPIEYHPQAECPTFESFLNRAQNGNLDNIEYIQRAVRYSATGATHEKCIFFLHGKTEGDGVKFLIDDLAPAELG